MKRLIVSVLMLMVATLIFSQGNNSDNEDQNVNQDLVKVESRISTETSL